MRPANAHLSREELDRLVEEGRAVGPATGEQRDVEALHRHLASCAACRSRLEACQAVEKRFVALRGQGGGRGGPECAAEAEWLRVAAGLAQPEEAEPLLRHAAQCDHCGQLLRQAVENFADELAVEEEANLARLPSAGQARQQALAKMLAEVSRAEALPRPAPITPGWVFAWLRPAAAAVALAVLAGAGWWFYQARRSYPPELLLARAYSEQRTLELRFPNAHYVPQRLERGPGTRSRLSRPPSLLEAEARIARELVAHPTDPRWLEAKGRAELLEWNYEAAIQDFTRAQEVAPEAPALWLDLAMAYFERAEAESRPIDYGKAIDLLGNVLAQNPNDPVALFNRAIAYERIFAYQQAIDDWTRYLKIDPRSGWADEARQHLANLRKKKAINSGGDSLSDDPESFLRLAREWTGHGGAAADSAVEHYFEVATTKWLPSAYRPGIALAPSHPTWRALELLAQILGRRHGDRWLRDMLAAPRSRDFSLGIEKLANAVSQNLAGNPDPARREAREAKRLFRSAGSSAGELRSRLEEVYALHRAVQGEACLAAARPLAAEIERRQYAWTHVQALMEEAICVAMVGEFGKAGQIANSTRSETQRAAYPVLHLRSLGLTAGLLWGSGDMLGAWSWDEAGLARYWTGSFPPARAYQFYSDLAYAAEDEGQWHLALGLWREAVGTISLTANRSVEAMARYQLAVAARRAGDRSTAVDELSRAKQSLESLPTAPAIKNYELYDEVTLAAVESEGGEYGQALARLVGLRPELASFSDSTVDLGYFLTLGSLYLRRGQFDDAERAFRSAVSIGEVGTKSFRSDRDALAWDREVGQAYRGLVEIKLRRDKDTLGALELWEWYRAAGLRLATSVKVKGMTQKVTSNERGIPFTALDAGPALAVLSMVQRWLPELSAETVIAYAQYPDGIEVWTFDNRGVHGHWDAIPAEKLERLVTRFARECADPGSDLEALRQHGHELYGLLVAPIAADLTSKRTLVVEPDGVLGRIPFAALVDDAGQYVAGSYAIVSSPGLGYEQRLEQGTQFSPRQRALVVGAPALAPGLARSFPPLPDAAREAASVAARFESARLLTGREATLEAVVLELPRAAVFHFAGHSVASGTMGGLLLAPSATGDAPASPAWTMLDAAHLRASQLPRCRLAVLSACPTEAVERDLLSDPEGLVRGFLRAGVPHVVATRWEVGSATTESFMNTFYSVLLAGNFVSQALQAACRAARNRPETAHPYYWAAFSAFGRR